MTREQELMLLTERLRVMIMDDQTNNQVFINTVETLLTLLEEYLEEQMTNEELRKIAIAMLITQEWRREQIEEEYLNLKDKEAVA